MGKVSHRHDVAGKGLNRPSCPYIKIKCIKLLFKKNIMKKEKKIQDEVVDENEGLIDNYPVSLDERERVDKLSPTYLLSEEVSFYLPGALEVNRGVVVGFFLSLDEGSETKGVYYYQIKYFKEMKDESEKMFLGTVTAEEMGRDDAEIKEKFKGIRLSRIEMAIEQGNIELNGAKTTTAFHKGVQKELETELVRLEKLK